MGGGGGGRLFEAGRLLSFSAFRMGTYSRWALIRGWAFIRINTVVKLYRSPGQPGLAAGLAQPVECLTTARDGSELDNYSGS